MGLISENQIKLDCCVHSKDELIDLFIQLLDDAKKIKDKRQFKKDVYEREKIANTAIGDEIAIPHALSTQVIDSSLVFIRLKDSIDWTDGDKVKYVFGIAVPKENKDNQHLKILSTLARNLLNEEFKGKLLLSSSKTECYCILNGIISDN
jgi:PTS system, fructose subfamily, IIA component